MLTVTAPAGALLVQMMEAEQTPEGAYVRLFLVGEDSPAVEMSMPEPGDIAAFCHDGRVVLILDQNTAAAVRDHVLGLEHLDDGPSLVLEPFSELATTPPTSPS